MWERCESSFVVMVPLEALSLPPGIMHMWPGVLLVPRQALVFWLVSNWRDGASAEQYRIKITGMLVPCSLAGLRLQEWGEKYHIPAQLSWLECCG